MLAKTGILLWTTALVTCAATVDSGTISAQAPVSGTGIFSSATMSSSDSGWMLSGFSGAVITAPFEPGTTITIGGFNGSGCDCDDTGSGVIGGVSYPLLIFDTSSSSVAGTSFEIRSAPVTVTTLGQYSIPFSMQGRLQVAVPGSSSLILDEPISGSGIVTVTVQNITPSGTATFAFGPSTWVFGPASSTPEPGLTLPLLGSLLFLVHRRRRSV